MSCLNCYFVLPTSVRPWLPLSDIALIKNNSQIGSSIAVELCRLRKLKENKDVVSVAWKRHKNGFILHVASANSQWSVLLLWFKFNLSFEFLKPYGHYHFSLQNVQSKLPAGMPDSAAEWSTLKRPVSQYT